MHIPRIVGAALAALTLVASPSTLAIAQEAEPPAFEGITLTPSRHEEDLGVRRATVSFTVFNNGELPHEIDLTVVGLGHELDGTPRFLEQSGPVATMSGPAAFDLAPGESREVELAVDFPDDVSAYNALLVAIDETTALTGQVGSVSRLAGLTLFRGPGPWDQTLELEASEFVEAQDGTVAELLLDLRNVGDAHVRPNGTVEFSQDGRSLGDVELTGETVLPGFARRHRVSWIPPEGTNGTVDFTLRTDDGETITGSAAIGGIAERVIRAREAAGLPSAGVEFGGLSPVQRLIWPILLAVLLLAIATWAWLRYGRGDEVVAGSGESA